jgi:SAM-dependent methyltransferase
MTSAYATWGRDEFRKLWGSGLDKSPNLWTSSSPTASSTSRQTKKVFSEAYRVLKPGGRLAVSDIVTYGPLPEAVRNSLEAWASCVAGALDETAYLDKMSQAGFTEVEVTACNLAEIVSLITGATTRGPDDTMGVKGVGNHQLPLSFLTE